MAKDNSALVVRVKNEINKELGDAETLKSLLATTFKGLEAPVMKRAIMEGMLRGFTFKDFLERNVYAIPFKDGYSLVSSIDHARKVGMRAGVVGKSAPTFEMDQKKVASCTITVKRQVKGVIGEWTATVFFDEYYRAGKNGYPSLWDSKPRTMIAKVAEMHALRMACPEELSQTYSEEEFDRDRENADFDRSEIEDDAIVISTGDDTPGFGAAEPENSPEKRATYTKNVENKGKIKKLLEELSPAPILKEEEYGKVAKELTGLKFEATNYEAILTKLTDIKNAKKE